MSVTAEGMETSEQFARLRELDCDYLQGYYFPKPMERERVLEMLRDPDAVISARVVN